MKKTIALLAAASIAAYMYRDKLFGKPGNLPVQSPAQKYEGMAVGYTNENGEYGTYKVIDGELYVYNSQEAYEADGSPQITYITKQEFEAIPNAWPEYINKTGEIVIYDTFDRKIVIAPGGQVYVIKDGEKYALMSEQALNDYIAANPDVSRQAEPVSDAKLSEYPTVGALYPGNEFRRD